MVQTFTCNTAGNAIGAYGVTFHKRAVIIYTTIGRCKGHFIRKKNWHSMLKDLDPELCRIIKRSFVQDYLENTKAKVIAHKKAAIQRLKSQGKYNDVMSLWELKNNSMF